MPIDNNGVGFSDWTGEKQKIFRGLVRIHLVMAYSAMKKWNCRQYKYFDLHSGPGNHPEYGTGSPLIFLDEADLFRSYHRDCSYRALMIDINENNQRNLMRVLDDRGCWHATVQNRDCKDVLLEYCHPNYKNQFGLFYCDPTKPEDMPFKELATISKSWKKADILMALSATQIKRLKHLNGHRSLVQYLAGIEKKQWLIKKPFGKHHWTFIYGTNGPVPEWTAEGFYNIYSKAGIEVLNELNLSKDERCLLGQLELPII